MVFVLQEKMIIANKAKFLYEEKRKEKEMPPSNVASCGWLQRFMSRHGLIGNQAQNH